MEQEMIQDTKDKEMSDMRSLWEERTSMFFDLIDLINTGADTENLIVDLEDNSEDIANVACGAFKFDSDMKRPDHEEYYYKLVEKNHPINGVKLTHEEDLWLRNYMSVSMLTRILKDNVRLLTDYFKCIKANDSDGQKITDERLISNVISIAGFLKTMSSTWDFELLNSSLAVYFRNLRKQSDILAGAQNPKMLEKELKISEEISQIIYKGMIVWRTELPHQN